MAQVNRHSTAEDMLAGIRAEMAAKAHFVQTVIRPAYHHIGNEDDQFRALEWIDEANEMQRAVKALDKAIISLAAPVKPKHVHRDN